VARGWRRLPSDAPVSSSLGNWAPVVLNRPEKRNAITLAMWRDLPALVATVERDKSVKLLILRGAGSAAFAAGADIEELRTVYASRDSAEAYRDLVAVASRSIADLTKPTIALIRGACVGARDEHQIAEA
jgi:enoyl-CoA hydratase/carnithine racemase